MCKEEEIERLSKIRRYREMIEKGEIDLDDLSDEVKEEIEREGENRLGYSVGRSKKREKTIEINDR
jgi:DNA-binding protein H-NS